MSPTRALLVILGVLLIATGCSSRGMPSETKPDAQSLRPADPGFAVWLGFDRAVAECPNALDAARFYTELSERGVRRVFLPVKTVGGRLGFPSGMGTGEAWLLSTCLEGARQAGVDLVVVYPLFLGEPEPGEELVEYAWNPEEGFAHLRPWRDSASPPRTNPLSVSNEERELAILRDLGALSPETVCISHAGFPNARSGFSDRARTEFETWLGQSVRTWPEDVLTFRPADSGSPEAVSGALRDEWLEWRASYLRQYLFRVEQALTLSSLEAGRGKPVFWIMAPGYYPLHRNEGVNWASNAARVDPVLPGARAGYAQTGVGELADGLVLEMFAPVVTAREASEAGLTWWSSVEGATQLAGRLIQSGKSRHVAINALAFAGSDRSMDEREREKLRAAVEAARNAGWMPLILDVDYLDRWDGWSVLARQP